MTTEKNPEAEYWQTVKSIAEEALQAEKNGDDASDYIHESVDGSHHVIYTYANLVCLQASKNESAAFEEMGSEALAGCNSYGDVMMRLAYHAMRADVEAELQELRDNAESEEPSDA